MPELTNHEETLYMRVYNYFVDMIKEGLLTEGSRILSIRQCAESLQLSKTTVETAYLMLAADGYIIAKPQSGYYVTGRGEWTAVQEEMDRIQKPVKPQYDFSSGAVDRESFDFNLWRRYIKSALRQDDRLLSYGEPQGEWELREALSEYLSVSKNVICRPEQIVIGAGTQSLLQILCPLMKDKREVSFPARSMIQVIAVFQDYGFDIHYKDKDAEIVYVSPSRMNRMGDVMPVKRRLELLDHASAKKSLIIEDDYENEFLDQNRQVPSLFGLAGGKGVVYLGTCSRLLLPSIRISYMVLPLELVPSYRKIAARYNQTASKTEQIALGQFIRDGNMSARIRKLRRLYRMKTRALYQSLKEVMGDNREIDEKNLCVTIVLKPEETEEIIYSEAMRQGLVFDGIVKDKEGGSRLVLSSLTMRAEDMPDAANAVRDFFTAIS